MRTVLKFITLVVILNVIRYLVGGIVEGPVTSRLFRVMEEHPAVFNNNFTAFDWTTSYFYNFLLWLVATWVFLLLAPHLNGNYVVRSLEVFGLMLLFFVSVSAVYMNHYTHPKSFYFWNCLDAVIVFAIVGVANGLLFPRIFKERAYSV